MSLLANLIKPVARKFGLEVSRTRPFGHDPYRDAAKILGPDAQIIFDVGANTGQTAERIARDFPRANIWSFEPFPKAFAELHALAGRLPRVKAFEMALGEREKSETLFLTNFSPTNSLLKPSKEANRYLDGCMDAAGSATVKVRMLDNFCAEQKIERIDLLKMDVQGYEMQVLQGGNAMLSRGAIRLIYSEVNFVQLYDGQTYFHDLYAFLLERGYRLVALYDPQYRAGCALNWCDALFAHSSVAG